MTLLREILEQHTVDELHCLFKLAQTSCSGTKTTLINWFIEEVLGKNLQKTWTLLLPIEQLAIAEAIYNNDGRIYPEQIKAKYGQKLVMGSDYISRYSSETIPAIRLFSYKGYPIPTELGDKLKRLVPEPKEAKMTYLQEPSTHNPRIEGTDGVLFPYSAEKLVLHDLLSVLALLKNEKLRVSSQTLMPTAALTSKIGKVLAEPDYYADSPTKSKSIRSFAWIILLKTAQLIRYHGDAIELTRAGLTLLSKPDARPSK